MAAAGTLGGGSARAATYSWTGGTTGAWNVAGNWTEYITAGTFPVAGDTAVFNGINNQNETIYLNAAEAAATVNFNNTGTTTLLGSNSGTSSNFALTLTAGINVFAGAGAVTIGDTTSGAGTNGATLTLTAGQTLSNNSANTLTIANALSVTTAAASTLTRAGSGNITTDFGIVQTAAGAVSLTKNGSGTLTETGTNANTYTGATSFTGGTVKLDYSQGVSRLSTGALALGGFTLNLSGAANTAVTQTVSGTTVAAGNSTIAETNSGNTTLALGGLTGTAVGGSLNFGAAGIATTTTANGTTGILGNRYTVGTTGAADWATGATTAGTATAIGAYQRYTAGLPATGATAVNYFLQGSGSVTATETANTLKIAGSSGTATGEALAIASGTTLALSGGGLLFTGAQNYAITGGTLRAATNGELVVSQYGAGNLTIGSVLGLGTGALTKTGPGTLTLSTDNTYTGATYVSAGTLAIGGTTAQALGTGTAAVSIGDTGTLDVSANANQQINALNSITTVSNQGATGRSVVLGGNTLALGSASTTGSFGGVISGTGGVTKNGANTQTLTGLSTYTGVTTVNGGILNVGTFANVGTASSIGAGSAAGSAGDLVLNGGSLQYTGPTSASTNRSFTIGGTATIDSSSGTAVLSGVNGTLSFTGTGPVTAVGFSDQQTAYTLVLTGTDSGYVKGGGGGGINKDAGNYTDTNIMGLQLTDDTTVAAPLTVTKSGTGTWLLSNTANSYSGGTNVTAGRLIALGTGTLGTGAVTATSSSSQLVLIGGTYANAFNISGVGLGQGATRSNSATNPGVLVLNNGANVAGTLTLLGNATLSAGLLFANASNPLTANQGTISGQITGNYALTVGDPSGFQGGVITLTNATNNFTGGLTIVQGTSNGFASAVVVGTPSTSTGGVIPHGANAGNVTIQQNYSGGAIGLVLNGNATTINGLANGSNNSTSATRFVSNNSATAATLTLGDGNATASFNGTLLDNEAYAGLPTTSGGALGLTKIGTGTQVLSGQSSYTGGTTISAGNLQLTNTVPTGTTSSTVSGKGVGAVALSGGTTTTISGTGNVNGLLTATSGSRIAPGVNTSGTNTNFGVAGTLYLGTNAQTGGIIPANGLTLTNASLDYDLSSTVGGTNDRVITRGALTLGTIAFTFNELTPGSLDTTAYTLISGATSLLGTGLANITGTVVQGDYTPTFSLVGDNLDVSFATAAVPEPSGRVLVLADRCTDLASPHTREGIRISSKT